MLEVMSITEISVPVQTTPDQSINFQTPRCPLNLVWYFSRISFATNYSNY